MADDDKFLHVGDYVIMPNHVHMLITPENRELEQCMKRIKGSSATLCNRLLNRTTFWQADMFGHIVRDLAQLTKYRRYIADNPSKARISVPPMMHYEAEWITRIL